MTGGVEDAVDSELRSVAGFEGFYTFNKADTGAGDSAGEVAASGVEGEILAPGSALAASFLDEEKLRGGREVVEVSDWDVEVLVGVVGSGLEVGFGGWFVIGRVVRCHGKRWS